MLDCDLELDVLTNEELLAEIGVDSHTIRRIRTEAACADAGEEGEALLG